MNFGGAKMHALLPLLALCRDAVTPTQEGPRGSMLRVCNVYKTQWIALNQNNYPAGMVPRYVMH